jgi:hypothetical protein
LKSCWDSRLPPRGRSSFGSSSSSVDNSTTLRFLLGGVLPASLYLLTRDLNLVSCRCFERRSYISMSVAVSSPPRSELSNPLSRGGDRTLFNLDPLLLSILSRGWRQGINVSHRTCKGCTSTTSKSARRNPIPRSQQTQHVSNCEQSPTQLITRVKLPMQLAQN